MTKYRYETSFTITAAARCLYAARYLYAACYLYAARCLYAARYLYASRYIYAACCLYAARYIYAARYLHAAPAATANGVKGLEYHKDRKCIGSSFPSELAYNSMISINTAIWHLYQPPVQSMPPTTTMPQQVGHNHDPRSQLLAISSIILFCFVGPKCA